MADKIASRAGEKRPEPANNVRRPGTQKSLVLDTINRLCSIRIKYFEEDEESVYLRKSVLLPSVLGSAFVVVHYRLHAISSEMQGLPIRHYIVQSLEKKPL